MPWACSRCSKRYIRRQAAAIAHRRVNTCRTPRIRAPRPNPPEPAARPRREGQVRNLSYHDVIRRDLKDNGFGKHANCAGCQQRRTNTPCNQCFFLDWMTRARDCPRWDDIVYGAEDGDVAVRRSRRGRWRPAEGDWHDPRQQPGTGP